MTTGNVHVGNVVEFHDHFLPAGLPGDVRRDVLAGDAEYASIAPFYSPDPGLVLLPDVDGQHWWDLQAELLRWEGFRPVPVSDPCGPSFDVLTRSPGHRDQVLAALADGSSLIAWGESPAYRRFVADLPDTAAVRSTLDSLPRYAESKLNSAEIFAKAYAALGSPAGVFLTGERVCETDDELSSVLAEAGQSGRKVVLKSPFGVGGYGTAVLGPHELGSPQQVHTLLRTLRETDRFHDGLPAVVQDYQWPSAAPWSDVSGDCTIDASGEVTVEGVTAMTVNGTQFAGGVTDDGVVLPAHRSRMLIAFCRSVGEVLSKAGYRGWFDVDFIVRVTGELVPLEINARRTGTTAPLSVQARASQLRGRPVTVICQDIIELPGRLDSHTAFDRFLAATAACELTGDVVPTQIAGTASAQPYLGVCVIATDGAEAVRRLAAFKDALVASCAA